MIEDSRVNGMPSEEEVARGTFDGDFWGEHRISSTLVESLSDITYFDAMAIHDCPALFR